MQYQEKQKHYEHPIAHFMIDMTSFNLKRKQNQMRKGENIRNKPFSGFELAEIITDI